MDATNEKLPLNRFPRINFRNSPNKKQTADYELRTQSITDGALNMFPRFATWRSWDALGRSRFLANVIHQYASLVNVHMFSILDVLAKFVLRDFDGTMTGWWMDEENDDGMTLAEPRWAIDRSDLFFFFFPLIGQQAERAIATP